jgi:MOSC domain-containing protein YiiM
MHAELLDELASKGMPVLPGVMGENVTTLGVDLLGLPAGAILRLGATATILVTGLRNPCYQLDGIHAGLKEAVLDRSRSGELLRKAGVMAVVIEGGVVRAGDAILVELPSPPHRPLEPV